MDHGSVWEGDGGDHAAGGGAGFADVGAEPVVGAGEVVLDIGGWDPCGGGDVESSCFWRGVFEVGCEDAAVEDFESGVGDESSGGDPKGIGEPEDSCIAFEQECSGASEVGAASESGFELEIGLSIVAGGRDGDAVLAIGFSVDEEGCVPESLVAVEVEVGVHRSRGDTLSEPDA